MALAFPSGAICRPVQWDMPVWVVTAVTAALRPREKGQCWPPCLPAGPADGTPELPLPWAPRVTLAQGDGARRRHSLGWQRAARAL